MKKSAYKSIFHLYTMFFLVFLLTVLVCIGGVFYFINIGTSKEHNNIIWSNWPIHFTEDFSKQIVFKDGKPEIKAEGIYELKRNNLWIQIIDENGDEITYYNKQAETPKHYTPIEILNFYKTENSSSKYTVFAKGIEGSGRKITYIIGFPLKIQKITMYLNYNNFYNGKTIIIVITVVISLFILIFGGFYGVWVTKQLKNVITSIRKLALRSYTSIDNKGLFQDVYESLNFVDNELNISEKERKRNEALREEWIANITHDLKTPLSPIKGYAELIMDGEYSSSPEDMKRYGGIIFKNAVYTEELINDLKITYQLKNGMIPLNKMEGNIVSLLRELVIDILNNPKYEKREIIFEYEKSDIHLCFDSLLLQRAFNNLLYNALIHNMIDTKILVSINKKDNKVYISVKDNGGGMDEEEVKRLFERYYKGTNQEVNANGTGLGMAIAKQIIEIHGGNIKVFSKKGSGTDILIEL